MPQNFDATLQCDRDILPYEEPLVLVNICIGAVMFSISMVGVLISLSQRAFPPIKAKSPHLVALALLASLAFWVAKMHAHGFLGYQSILQECSLWGIWLQFPLGVCLMSAVLGLRYQRLYVVLVMRRSARTFYTYLPTLVYAVVVLSCSILATAMSKTAGFYWDHQLENCFATQPSIYMFFGCTLLGTLMLAVLTWLLRGIRDAFNEYSETRYGALLFFFFCVINALLIYSKYRCNIWAKHTMVLVAALCGNIYFWLVMARPIYGCLFDRQRCQQRFMAGLEIEHNHSLGMYAREQAALQPIQEQSIPMARLAGHRRIDSGGWMRAPSLKQPRLAGKEDPRLPPLPPTGPPLPPQPTKAPPR